MHINDLLKMASERKASDLHLKVGSHPVLRINGELIPLVETKRLMQEDTIAMAFSIMKQLGLRGGGRPDFAQGGGVEPGDVEALRMKARDLLRGALEAVPHVDALDQRAEPAQERLPVADGAPVAATAVEDQVVSPVSSQARRLGRRHGLGLCFDHGSSLLEKRHSP